jgi:uncharacterized protein (DUF849 family)
MIIQACLNGARPADYHSALPLTPKALASDAAACIAAGAAELHVHPRGADGRESLSPEVMDQSVLALRRSCPGTLVGVSTGEWIEKGRQRTLDAIAGWRELPDYASVNLSEKDAPAVMDLLERRGVGIEAGLASAADAERFVGLKLGRPVHRILIEISEQELERALEVADEIMAVLERANVRRPILAHGFDATVWPFVSLAAGRRWSTRVGLEDGCELQHGELASGNAALVAEAVAIFRPAAAKGVRSRA